MMERNEILKELTEIFQEVFDDESITLREDTTANDIEDWDSLQHICLIMAIEEHFSVKFAIEEIVDMKNIGAMVDIVEKRVG